MAKRNTATAKVLPQRCSIVTYHASALHKWGLLGMKEIHVCFHTAWYIKLHVHVCEHFQNLRAGGRPKTLQHCGRHYSKYANHLIRHMKGIAPTSLNVPGMQPPARSIWHSCKGPLCFEVLDQPLELMCSAIVCAMCLKAWVVSIVCRCAVPMLLQPRATALSLIKKALGEGGVTNLLRVKVSAFLCSREMWWYPFPSTAYPDVYKSLKHLIC